MKLVVGLGNPGEKYQNTRHNVGFLVVDRLRERLDEGKDRVLFLKPDKFMNQSGAVVKAFLKKHPKVKPEEMYVAHDDLDIKLGEYKISFGKGPRDHYGLKSINEQLGTKEFWHVRVGIDGPRGEVKSGEEYVLSSFRPEEKSIVNSIVNSVVKAIVKL